MIRLIMRLKLGAVHRSSGIYLTAYENSRKPQLGGQSDEDCVNNLLLKWASLTPDEVSWLANLVREGDGRKGWGSVLGFVYLLIMEP